MPDNSSTATPVQDTLFGIFGEVQVDIFDAIAEVEHEQTTAARHADPYFGGGPGALGF